jgi:hypothetical protein
VAAAGDDGGGCAKRALQLENAKTTRALAHSNAAQELHKTALMRQQWQALLHQQQIDCRHRRRQAENAARYSRTLAGSFRVRVALFDATISSFVLLRNSNMLLLVQDSHLIS